MPAQLAFPNFNYLTFLQELKKAGDKFPFAWKILLHITQDSQDLIELMKPSTPVPAQAEASRLMLRSPQPQGLIAKVQATQVDHIQINPEVENAEQVLLRSLSEAPGRLKLGAAEGAELKAIGDGTFLRAFFAFLQANPQLMSILLSLFGIKLPGTAGQSQPGGVQV